jgi:hypothetical protein
MLMPLLVFSMPMTSYAYIAVHIQRLYTVYNGAGVRSTVAMLGLAMNQGRRQPPLPSFSEESFQFDPSSL